MQNTSWLLYGAYGYTGELIALEALERGHRPTLCGRSRDKLRPLAERLGLPYEEASLENPERLQKAISGHALVLHAAGPFVHTSEPMIQACLAQGAHYLDITGEIPVFENTFEHDREAREKNVALISGVGFDVVPTDCMARYVAEKLQDPTELHIAFSAAGSVSAGTAKSALEGLPKGGAVRRDGILIPYTLGQGARRLRFLHGEKHAVPIPWGDLVTAFHTTGVQNITTYMTLPEKQAKAMKLLGPVLPYALKPPRIRELLATLIDKRIHGPSETNRQKGRSHVYVEARNAKGERAEAWLETVEGYRFTAHAALRAVERTLGDSPKGALTPARAFGADFVLEVPETRRVDQL